MSASQRHIAAIPIPEATSQALAMLRDQRDHYRAEAKHLRHALKSILGITDPRNVGQDSQLLVRIIYDYSARMLLYEPYQRKRRGRLALWWDRCVAARWQTWMAR
jgi:hypothetical protein